MFSWERDWQLLSDEAWPLDKDIAETFSGARCREIVLAKDTDLYRAGVSYRDYGQYLSLDKPRSVIQTRMDKALLPVWPGGGTSPLDTKGSSRNKSLYW